MAAIWCRALCPRGGQYRFGAVGGLALAPVFVVPSPPPPPFAAFGLLPAFASLDPAWFPKLAVVLDGRNSLRDLRLPAGVAYLGIGLPGRTGG